MLLKQLHEESIGELRARWKPKEMTPTEMVEWMENNAKSFLSNKSPIYRGMGENQTGFLNTTGLKRDSANSNGYYNWWIDNHPAWSNYPKRAGSIICSTYVSTAEAFGDLYLIIPSDHAKIGICSEGDIWGSFQDIPGNVDLNDFMGGELPDIMTGGHARNWEQLSRNLKRTTIQDVSDSMSNLSNSIVDKMEDDGVDNLYDFFADSMLDPQVNGFRSTTGAHFKQGGDHEVWVGGELLQIEFSKLQPPKSADDDSTLYAYLTKFYRPSQLEPD